MSSKVFIGYGFVAVAGAIGFYLSRVYIGHKKPEILAARERIHQRLLNAAETEETPLAYTKAYREETKRKIKELEKNK